MTCSSCREPVTKSKTTDELVEEMTANGNSIKVCKVGDAVRVKLRFCTDEQHLRGIGAISGFGKTFSDPVESVYETAVKFTKKRIGV